MLDAVLRIINATGLVALALLGVFPQPILRRRILFAVIGSVLTLSATVALEAINLAELRKRDVEIHESETRRDQILQQLAVVVMQARPALDVAPLTSPTIEDLSIAEPPQRAIVGPRHLVTGSVADADTEVWVVVHPLSTSAYWVQPRVSVDSRSGRWQVLAYFGGSGTKDRGELFEVVAIAQPKELLQEGAVLDRWPASEWRSQIVAVERE